jgi:hypothetical protein
MLSKKISGVVAIAGATVVALLAAAPAAISGSPSSLQSHAEYKPIQSISYEFGSKSMSGYFLRDANACMVMLMVSEKSDPEDAIATTPTRVRLSLTPGQVAGLDSEEGHSVNVTCGVDASILIVDTGNTRNLIARQTQPAGRDIAKRD